MPIHFLKAPIFQNPCYPIRKNFNSYTRLQINSDTNSIGNLSEVDEIFLGVEPYLFEPEYDTLDELMVEASANANLDFDSLEPIVESRAGNLDWCSCGNCRVMGRDIDSVCCREVNAIPEESFKGMLRF